MMLYERIVHAGGQIELSGMNLKLRNVPQSLIELARAHKAELIACIDPDPVWQGFTRGELIGACDGIRRKLAPLLVYGDEKAEAVDTQCQELRGLAILDPETATTWCQKHWAELTASIGELLPPAEPAERQLTGKELLAAIKEVFPGAMINRTIPL